MVWAVEHLVDSKMSVLPPLRERRHFGSHELREPTSQVMKFALDLSIMYIALLAFM